MFEGVSNENMFYFQDGYCLYKANDDTIYIISDRNMTYMEMSLDGLLKKPGIGEINKMFIKRDIKTGIPDLDQLIQKEMEQQKKLGFPLKIITHQIQKIKKRKVKSKNSSTMEVSKIKTKTFPKGFFEIPGEYDRVNGPTEGKKLGIF